MNREFAGNWQFPDQQIQTENAPVNFKGVTFKLKTFLQKPSLQDSESALQLTSRDLQAELSIAEVSVDHVVERAVGGVTGRFRVQAHCENVVLQLTPGQGSFALTLVPAINGSSAGATVQAVNLSWLPGSWSTGDLQCQGVEGFSDILKAEVERIANDSESFVAPRKTLIAKYVQDYLQAADVDFSEAKELIVARPDIRVLMKVSEYRDLKQEGVRVRGNLYIDFLRAPDKEVKILNLGSSKVSVSNEAHLRLPKELIREIILRAYAGDSWMQRVYSNSIPGFASLMQSRFSQFFVWPELMRFAKSTQFIFDLSSPKDPGIQGEGLSYHVNVPLVAKMWAPRSGSYVPFMNFTLPFSSQVQLNVSSGKVAASFLNSNLGLSSQWDSSYVNRYSPTKRFSSSTIRDRILKGLSGKTVTVAVPAIPVSEGVNLKVQKLLAPKGEDLVLKLAP